MAYPFLTTISRIADARTQEKKEVQTETTKESQLYRPQQADIPRATTARPQALVLNQRTLGDTPRFRITEEARRKRTTAVR